MNAEKIMFLLEDDTVMLTALKESFQEVGFRVDAFTNEHDLRNALGGDVRPSLVLLDIMVPVARLTKEVFESITKTALQGGQKLPTGVSAGMRIARDIKKTSKYPLLRGVPIVIYSILDEDEFRTEAADLNVRYFVKGIDETDDLIQFVVRIVEGV